MTRKFNRSDPEKVPSWMKLTDLAKVEMQQKRPELCRDCFDIDCAIKGHLKVPQDCPFWGPDWKKPPHYYTDWWEEK